MGRYEVVRELGAGGAGAVYEAIDPDLGRRVALKVLLAPEVPGAERRFELEAQALSAVAHPNVVRLHELFRAGDRLCVAMELVRGGSLQDRLQREGPLPVRQAATYLRDVARAVAHVHARGVLHRDLKPANILIDDLGRARVSDFGLALASDRERLTLTGELLGTPVYMAPEQVSGERGTVGPPADVYALGATLFALLTGGPPFGGETLVNVLSAVFTTAAPPPSARRPEVDAVLDAICLRCLEKEPAARWPSAGALADALDAYLARPPGAPSRRRPRARRLVLGALAALGLAGAALGSAWVRRAPATPVPAPAPVSVVATSSVAPPPRPPVGPPAASSPPVTPVSWREKQGMLTPRFGLEGGLPWDEERQALLCYGGVTVQDGITRVHSDFWAWDGAKWAPIGLDRFALGQRYSHAFVVDPGLGRPVAFGGMSLRPGGPGRSVPEGDVWAWSGVDFELRRRSSSESPGGRFWMAVTACPGRRSVLLFGGRRGVGGDLPDLWEWTGEEGRWARHTLTRAPAARSGAAVAWDSRREVLVLFGGTVKDEAVADTWEWDGARWEERRVDLAPPARAGHAMVYDGARALLHGGRAGDEMFDDTWTWDGTRWERLELAPRPAARERHGVGWDPRRRVMVVVGGRGTGEVALSDVWELGP
jgi:hypothetical protein